MVRFELGRITNRLLKFSQRDRPTVKGDGGSPLNLAIAVAVKTAAAAASTARWRARRFFIARECQLVVVSD